MTGSTDLHQMLTTLSVSVRPGRFGILSLTDPALTPPLGDGVEALIREDEGTTVIATTEAIETNGWSADFVGAWLTLEVHSSLEAVGLTAAFAAALGEGQIPCNVIAGYFHDHILVPSDLADAAVTCLHELRKQHAPPGAVSTKQAVTVLEPPPKRSMVEVSRHEIAADPTLGDWRFLLGRIEAIFDAGSFAAAADFVLGVARLSDAADHHPDIDLRYPGRVHIALSTHETHSLTMRDVSLARSISELAGRCGYSAETASLQRLELMIDATDPEAVLPFWQAVFAYERVGSSWELADPKREGVVLAFQKMGKPRTQRNRVHFDLSLPHDEAEVRLTAALAAGGTLVSDARARAFWILADAEGNEICICTWQDRD